MQLRSSNMEITKAHLSELSYKIIGCAIEVHRELGPGLLESVYEKCFIHELIAAGLSVRSQKTVGLNYKGLDLDVDLRYDVLVEGLIVVELKAMDGLLPIHEAVLLTYMKLLKKPKGILINFNSTNIMKNGLKTMVNELFANLPD